MLSISYTTGMLDMEQEESLGKLVLRSCRVEVWRSQFGPAGQESRPEQPRWSFVLCKDEKNQEDAKQIYRFRYCGECLAGEAHFWNIRD